MTTKAQLHQLVEELLDSETDSATRLLQSVHTVASERGTPHDEAMRLLFGDAVPAMLRV